MPKRSRRWSQILIYEPADCAEGACEGVAARLFPFSDPLYSLDLMSLVGVSVRPILRLWVAQYTTEKG